MTMIMVTLSKFLIVSLRVECTYISINVLDILSIFASALNFVLNSQLIWLDSSLLLVQPFSRNVWTALALTETQFLKNFSSLPRHLTNIELPRPLEIISSVRILGVQAWKIWREKKSMCSSTTRLRYEGGLKIIGILYIYSANNWGQLSHFFWFEVLVRSTLDLKHKYWKELDNVLLSEIQIWH